MANSKFMKLYESTKKTLSEAKEVLSLSTAIDSDNSTLSDDMIKLLKSLANASRSYQWSKAGLFDDSDKFSILSYVVETLDKAKSYDKEKLSEIFSAVHYDLPKKKIHQLVDYVADGKVTIEEMESFKYAYLVDKESREFNKNRKDKKKIKTLDTAKMSVVVDSDYSDAERKEAYTALTPDEKGLIKKFVVFRHMKAVK